MSDAVLRQDALTVAYFDEARRMVAEPIHHTTARSFDAQWNGGADQKILAALWNYFQKKQQLGQTRLNRHMSSQFTFMNTMGAAGSWMGVMQMPHYERISFFVKGSGKALLGFKNESGLRAPDKTHEFPIWQTPFRINYYVDTGGELFINSSSGGTVTIYGGKTSAELNNSAYRNALPRWGR